MGRLSRFSKLLRALGAVVVAPRRSASWVWRGLFAKDRIFVEQTYWFTGDLPRVPLVEVLPGSRTSETVLPNSFDRVFGTSITAEEACHLAAISHTLQARRILE